jgi:hypothetical protein
LHPEHLPGAAPPSPLVLEHNEQDTTIVCEAAAFATTAATAAATAAVAAAAAAAGAAAVAAAFVTVTPVVFICMHSPLIFGQSTRWHSIEQ